MTAAVLPTLGDRLARRLSGLTAIAFKELRGRMRGRRAFIILTVYLALLGTYGWMLEVAQEQTFQNVYANQAAFASAAVGQGIFDGLLLLETLLVVVLAPALTAGAISLEREKQTLDMLAATPMSPLAIVVGKLVSALVYLLILVLASVPLSALVFVFGGVAPDDVLRGYVVLIATAIGVGSLGLFFSALARRTQAATVATYVTVLAVTLGASFAFDFWQAVGTSTSFSANGTTTVAGRPPEALLYLNPYFAQSDVLCGVSSSSRRCQDIWRVTGSGGVSIPTEPGVKPGFGVVGPGVGGGGRGVAVDGGPDQPNVAINGQPRILARIVDVPVPVDAFTTARDLFWPRSVAAWLIISVVFTALSVQLVTPARRWRPRLPGFLRRRGSKSAA